MFKFYRVETRELSDLEYSWAMNYELWTMNYDAVFRAYGDLVSKQRMKLIACVSTL